MAFLAALAGGLLGAGGAFLGGRAGDIARERLEDAADMPGLDVNAITGESLTGMEQYLLRATALAGKIGAAEQAQLNAQEELALPGVGAARQNALGNINSLFADDATWLQGVQRRGAALGLSSGLGSSRAGQLATLRLSDTEKMGRTQLGTGLLGSLIGSMRLANTPGVQAFLGPNPSQLINVRGQERAQRQNLMAQAAGIPGQTAAWGNFLTQTGGALMGGGMMGMMGGGFNGGWGGGSSNTQYMSQANQMSRLYGPSTYNYSFQ